MNRVSRVIIKQSIYDYRVLKPQVFEMMDALGGTRIGPGSRVLIKPNFLSSAGPETAVCTHPLVTRAAAEYVIERGARPQVSDSPAIGSFGRIMKESGTAAALQGLDVVCKPFQSSVPVDIGEPFGRIELAEDAVRADFIINLPKLKTHNLMVLTMAVKNLFGCVIGFKKPEWHLKMGSNTEMLARLFVRIHEAVRPGLTVMDGILAMEGEGPGKGGRPKTLGIIAAGDNDFALDRAVCRLIGIDPEALPIYRNASALGIGLEPFEIEGDLPAVGKLKLPVSAPAFGTGRIQEIVRRVFLPKPVVADPLCKSCMDCRKVCPVGAVVEEGTTIRFDYDKCIRCYCCTEVCPHGALGLSEPSLGKVIKKLLKF